VFHVKRLLKWLGRPRFWGVWMLPIFVLGVLFAIDPDNGLSLAVWLASFSRAFLIVACAHLIRKLFFDYPSADMDSLFGMARNTPAGGHHLRPSPAGRAPALLARSPGPGHAGRARRARELHLPDAQPVLEPQEPPEVGA
jgi:hypothetical protein